MTPSAAALAAVMLTLQATGGPAASPLAQPAPPEPSATVPTVTVIAHRPSKLAGVTVTAMNWCPEPQPARYPAAADPQVVDSHPRQGAATAPGFTLVRVTFNAPMSCYGEVTTRGGAHDPCEAQGTWVLPDRRSFLMQCRLEPGVAYTLEFRKDGGPGFVGLSGRAAEPFILHITTISAPPVASWAEATDADPGPPGARVARAYVTCAGAEAASPGDDCRHQRFSSMIPPP